MSHVQEDLGGMCGSALPPSPTAAAITPTEALRQARGFAGGFDSIWSGHAPGAAAGSSSAHDGTWSPCIAASWDRTLANGIRGLATSVPADAQGDRAESW